MSSVTGMTSPCRIITVLVLGIALAACFQPVLATGETFTITYRGAGGYYIGETIIFDGINKVGNQTLLKITGPDLPADGVPLMDLAGTPGTGSPVVTNEDGTWHYVWYTTSIKNLDRLQTARYKIIALDAKDPASTATTSIMMKKPELSAVASPSSLQKDEYLWLTGTADQGAADIRIEVSDANGKVLRTGTTGATESGYFSYAFHVDMDPGVYYVTVTSPMYMSTYRTTFTVLPPRSAANGTVTTAPAIPSGSSAGTPAATTGTLSISSTPSGAAVYIDSTLAGSTPITQGDITPGTHLVEIKNPGYSAYSAYAVVRAGEITTVSPALTKNASFLPLSPLSALAGLVIAGALIGIAATSRRTR